MTARIYNLLYYWLPVCLYCLLIFIQSSNPAPEQIPPLPYLDKLIHLGAYAVLGVLFVRAFASANLKGHRLLVPILAAVAASLYGISDEIHQAFVPFREADHWDAIADILGSIIGVALFYLYLGRTRRRAQRIP
jgi:VanZ family protein